MVSFIILKIPTFTDKLFQCLRKTGQSSEVFNTEHLPFGCDDALKLSLVHRVPNTHRYQVDPFILGLLGLGNGSPRGLAHTISDDYAYLGYPLTTATLLSHHLAEFLYAQSRVGSESGVSQTSHLVLQTYLVVEWTETDNVPDESAERFE